MGGRGVPGSVVPPIPTVSVPAGSDSDPAVTLVDGTRGQTHAHTSRVEVVGPEKRLETTELQGCSSKPIELNARGVIIVIFLK